VLTEAQQQEQALHDQLQMGNDNTGEAENAQSGRDTAAFMMDETIDQLFGDFAFFVCETMMDNDIELEDTPTLIPSSLSIQDLVMRCSAL
jgi:short subunit dehydrogenase-like uncharacterized protein